MNKQSTSPIPHIADRIKSLFKSARRYRLLRDERARGARVLPCEQQLELGLEL
jgi:hypothetical protein